MSRFFQAFVALIAILILSACSTETTTTTSSPSFELGTSSDNVTIIQGQSTDITISVQGNTDFTSDSKLVNLILENNPAGVAFSFSPTQTSSQSTLNLSVSDTTTPGTTTVTVKGTGDGLATKTVVFNLTVEAKEVIPPASFTMATGVPSVQINQGSNKTIPITITGNPTFVNESKSVNLSLEGNPAGVSFAFTPPATGTTSNLKLTVASTATEGTTTLTIKGSSNGLDTQTSTVDLTIKKPATTTPVPIGANVKVQIKSIKINNDCDVPGNGEIYGNVKVDGVTVFEIPKSTARSIGSGETITVNKESATKAFTFFTGTNEITISGFLKDEDSFLAGSDDDVANWNFKINPFDYAAKVKTSSPDCSATLRYQVVKVSDITLNPLLPTFPTFPTFP